MNTINRKKGKLNTNKFSGRIYTVTELSWILNRIKNKKAKIYISIDEGDTLKPFNFFGKCYGKYTIIYSETISKMKLRK
jgi:hypothetical protein